MERKIRSGEKGSIFDVAGTMFLDAAGKWHSVPRKLYKSSNKEMQDYFMSPQYRHDWLYEKDEEAPPYVPYNNL